MPCRARGRVRPLQGCKVPENRKVSHSVLQTEQNDLPPMTGAPACALRRRQANGHFGFFINIKKKKKVRKLFF